MSKKSQDYEARERRKCRSKLSFQTIEGARERQMHDWNNSKLCLQIYICNWCDNFHLASNLRDPAFQSFKIEERKALKEIESIGRGFE